MILTPENYHGNASGMEYVSNSQISAFGKCEACAMAVLRGEWREPPNKALLLGNYCDRALLTPERVPEWTERHQEALQAVSLYGKKGTPNKGMEDAEEWIRQARDDAEFMGLLEGEKQVLMTGVLGSVPCKILVDVLTPEWITDLKTTASVEDQYSKTHGGYVPFYEIYNYWRQAAIYQEVVRQLYGDVRPVRLAVISKRTAPAGMPPAHIDKQCIVLDDRERLAQELSDAIQDAANIEQVKRGQVKPRMCRKCDYCRSVMGVVHINASGLFGEWTVGGDK